MQRDHVGGEGRFPNRPYQIWLRRRWVVCEVMTVTAGGNEGGMTEGDGFPPPSSRGGRLFAGKTKGGASMHPIKGWFETNPYGMEGNGAQRRRATTRDAPTGEGGWVPVFAGTTEGVWRLGGDLRGTTTRVTPTGKGRGDGFPPPREQRRRGRGNNGWEEGVRDGRRDSSRSLGMTCGGGRCAQNDTPNRGAGDHKGRPYRGRGMRSRLRGNNGGGGGGMTGVEME